MQVAPAIAKHCPFLMESDILSLSPGFRLNCSNNTLEDTALGVAHQLQPQAHALVIVLVRGLAVAELRNLAVVVSVKDLQLTELLGALNITGGLLRSRAARAWPKAPFIQLSHLLMGIMYSRLSWRRPGTPANVFVGVARASLPVSISAALVGSFMVGSGTVSLGTGALAVGFGLAVFLLSIFLHELVHILLARRGGAQTAVLQRGMRLGILHRTLPPHIEIRSALAGPAVGLGTGLVAASCVFALSPTLGLLGCSIGLFHLGGLLPWYGDGISLRRARQQRRSGT